jgi:hypothetical protein
MYAAFVELEFWKFSRDHVRIQEQHAWPRGHFSGITGRAAKLRRKRHKQKKNYGPDWLGRSCDMEQQEQNRGTDKRRSFIVLTVSPPAGLHLIRKYSGLKLFSVRT